MSSTSAPLPLHLPGAVLARHEDVNAMTRWMFRADRYTARVLREIQAPRRDRATTWLLRVLRYPAYLAFWGVNHLYVRGGPRRVWLSPGRDACLAVAARRDGWHLVNHLSAEPGTGRAAQLRREVVQALAAAADEHQATIHVEAATERLAGIYLEEWPELVDHGKAMFRGRRLRRDPRPRAGSDELAQPR